MVLGLIRNGRIDFLGDFCICASFFDMVILLVVFELALLCGGGEVLIVSICTETVVFALV